MNKGMFSSERDNWETPQSLFDKLDAKYHFTLDAASSDDNAKVAKHYTEETDGLSKPWEGERVFCNPPYGREVGKWVKKCANEASHSFICLLIPARTDTSYFHEYIYGNPSARIEFLRGRLKFELGGAAQGPAPFPSMLVYFGGVSGDE